MSQRIAFHQRSGPRGSRFPPLVLLVLSIGAALVLTFETVACVFSDDTETLVVIVGPELRDCAGAGPMKCLEVNGEIFYETIEGFECEEGFIYRLKIERYNAWPGDEDPLRDESSYRYRLIEVMSKTSARP